MQNLIQPLVALQVICPHTWIAIPPPKGLGLRRKARPAAIGHIQGGEGHSFLFCIFALVNKNRKILFKGGILLLFFILFNFFPSSLYSQVPTIPLLTGCIVSDIGDSLPRANILEIGTVKGTTADSNGYFNLKLEKIPTSIQISFVGYETKIVNIDNYPKTDKDFFFLLY